MTIDLKAFLDNAMKAERSRMMERSDQLTLGEIISKCETIALKRYKRSDDTEPEVRFDFEYLFPTEIGSWRGSYEELALNFKSHDNAEPMSLSDFIKMLKAAVGQTYQGYKGGDFTMSRHTPVWVANYGNSGNTAVIEVVDNDYEVILMTGWRELM